MSSLLNILSSATTFRTRSRLLANCVRVEISRLRKDRVFWFSCFLLSAIVVLLRLLSLFLSNPQLWAGSGRPVPVSERLPASLALIQSNYDLLVTVLTMFLFLFPLIHSAAYTSSICLDTKQGVIRTIAARCPLYTYYQAKLIVSALSSAGLFGQFYLLDVLLALLLHPLYGTDFFQYNGNIFTSNILESYTSLPIRHPWLFFAGMMLSSILVYILYGLITCSLAFLTRLKYPAILLSAMILGVFGSLLFEILSKPSGVNLNNLAIGRLPYFYLHNGRGISPQTGLLICSLAVITLVFGTSRYLKRQGDIC